jgi:eukaryotic-like serine/threonine-protein kinase
MAAEAQTGSGWHSSLIPGKQITKGVSLLKQLSAGGMGAVWLADHLSLKTQVVVKFMLGGLDSSDSARTRFSREAAAAAQVKSPHVVQMLDHGVSDDGIPFIVMEHLEGHDLGDEIEKHGALDFAKVVAVVGQVAKALSKVHAAGLLHRDIKPDNIFLVDGEEDVFVKLLDFGIAKSSLAADDGSLDGETKTGQVVGTPFYMSPEQVTAQKVIDHRSDLWALGIVAFEALTGERPYDGPSFGALAVKIATGSPKRPTEANPNLPPALDQWFAKACAREPAGRFGSAKEMSDAFRAAFEGVVSLPAGVVSSDSGQRARSGSMPDAAADTGPNTKKAGSGSGSGSGPREGVATLGLAKTALDDSDSDASKQHVALGRSEAGVSSVVEDRPQPPRGARFLYVGGAVVLSVIVAIVLVTTFRPGSSGGGGGGGGGGAVSTSAPTATTPASTAALPIPTTPPTTPPSSAPATSATPAAASTPAVATKAVPTKIPTAVKTAPTKPDPTPTTTTTKPPPKPTDTAPDLF